MCVNMHRSCTIGTLPKDENNGERGKEKEALSRVLHAYVTSLGLYPHIMSCPSGYMVPQLIWLPKAKQAVELWNPNRST